jgi:dCMP deaminase
VRPGWDDYFLNIAQAVSARADCTRRQVGAVIVRERRIVSTGYNGAPSGHLGCLSDGACPRGQHFALGPFDNNFCKCGNPWPCPEWAVPGSSYDTGPGACVALHAEQNALLYASRDA